MANTLIQIKRSTVTATPPNGSLAVGEQAYSYSSNTLFIGTPDGAGVIAVGGKYYLDTITSAFAQANAAYQAANTGASVSAAYDQANTARTHANTAHATANASYAYANSAGTTANAVYGFANSAHSTANAAYGFANSAHTVANNAYVHANSAFAKANAALPSAGGTISGDLVVSGNITVSGITTYANTQTLLIGDNIFVLNADLPSTSAPSENAGFTVNRGSSSNVDLIWNEGSDRWSMQLADGSYRFIASNSDVDTVTTAAAAAFLHANSGYAFANSAHTVANGAYSHANAAYAYANSAGTTANAAYAFANSAHSTANAAYGFANSAHTVANNAYVHANNAYFAANSASAQAANADFLTTGTVHTNRISGSYTGITGLGTVTVGTWQANTIGVEYGGTGMISFTTNGILFGNSTGALKVTAAGTEGQVLQASSTGVPQFGMLDGGNF